MDETIWVMEQDICEECGGLMDYFGICETCGFDGISEDEWDEWEDEDQWCGIDDGDWYP